MSQKKLNDTIYKGTLQKESFRDLGILNAHISGSDGLTFDVTLDTKEIGYGELEREIRSVSELYGEPSIRGSSLSSSSGVSSRSSPRSSVLRSSNSSSISSFSKLDQLYRLLEDVTDPVSILCQSLEVEDDVAHLDEKLSQMMESTDALGIISSQSVLDSVTGKYIFLVENIFTV